MSKSLGNSPDPLDLIDQYGADGVRIGMLFASPAGNDLLYKESLVEQGQKFANKIWNAFRLLQTWEVADIASSERDELALAWMEARIDEVAAEIDDHFEKFRISDALMSVYKLKWDDYCSHFLEYIKPEYGKPIARATLEGAISLFEKTIQLIHPFMPFITEELWHGLRDRSEGEYICTSRLFETQATDKSVLEEMALIKEAISAVRNFRISKNIPMREEIALFIQTDEAALFKKYESILSWMLKLSEMSFVTEKVSGAGSIRVQAHQMFIPLGAVDIEAEREKIQKEIEYTEGFLQKVLKKLSNERFVANAPENVVAMERKKQADAEAKLEVL
ncbi:MAG: class I tRNA ligase family protein, partial [Bacteroidota bacterium]